MAIFFVCTTNLKCKDPYFSFNIVNFQALQLLNFFLAADRCEAGAGPSGPPGEGEATPCPPAQVPQVWSLSPAGLSVLLQDEVSLL